MQNSTDVLLVVNLTCVWYSLDLSDYWEILHNARKSVQLFLVTSFKLCWHTEYG